MIFGDIGEDLAIESDIFRFESGDESGVCHAERSDSGIDACLPESAGVSLLVLAVSESVGAGVLDGDFSFALFGRAAEAIAFDGFQNIFSPLQGDCSSFNSCHKLFANFCLSCNFRLSNSSINVREESSAQFVGEHEIYRHSALELFDSALFGIEMVKARLSGFQLAALGDAYSFG